MIAQYAAQVEYIDGKITVADDIQYDALYYPREVNLAMITILEERIKLLKENC